MRTMHNTGGGVNVLNLVEGDEAVVESPTGSFPDFVVHYAETFIVPAAVGAYRIRPCASLVPKEYATVKAFADASKLHPTNIAAARQVLGDLHWERDVP